MQSPPNPKIRSIHSNVGHPDHDREGNNREHDQPPVRQAREELQRDRDPAELRRECHQVHDLRRDQRHHRALETDSLANGVEHGPARNSRDPAAHLRVDDDADQPDHDHPEQLIAEGRARGDVEHEVADVHEPADRGDNPQRETEHLAHVQLPSFFSVLAIAAPTARSDG